MTLDAPASLKLGGWKEQGLGVVFELMVSLYPRDPAGGNSVTVLSSG